MKKLNIAYITKENSRDKKEWSGTSNNIYKCLRKTGHNIERYGPFKSIFEKFLKLVELFYKLLDIKFDPSRNFLLSKIIAKKIQKKIKEKNLDLIVVHDCTIISFLNTTIPIIIWTDLTFELYQRSYFLNYKKFHKNSLKSGHYLEKLSLNKAIKVIYSTKYAQDSAIKKYKINKIKTKVIPFGSDILPISKKLFLNSQKKNKKKNNKIKFISVGVDWDRKNMGKSIEVVNELNKMGINSFLTIVGSQPPKTFNIPKYVNIVPFLDKKNSKDLNKLKKIYFNSDYFILLSKAEAFGLVLLEANSYGLPLILNDIDGMKFVAKKEYTIFVKKNLSVNKIALKILSLIKNNSKYRRFSYNSFLSSFNNTWDIASNRLARVINDIL